MKGKKKTGTRPERESAKRRRDELERSEDTPDDESGEELSEAIWEFAPDGMIIIDDSGAIAKVNVQAEQMFGYAQRELLGKPIEALIPDRFRAKHQEHRAEYQTSPSRRPMCTRLDLFGLRKDGREFPADVSLSPLMAGGQALIICAVRDITERRKLEQVVKEREAQLLAAKTIQQRLLPGRPPRILGYEVFGASFPADYAGGDSFDYLELADGSFWIVISDVTGHGIGPALVMASIHTAVHLLVENQSEPGAVMQLANSFILNYIEDCRFVTMLLARIDPASQSLVVCNAGHPPAFILGQSGVIKARLEAQSHPIGIASNAVFPASDPAQLEPGDIALLLTDGVLEATCSRGELFGIERALQVVCENSERTAEEIVGTLYRAVREFSGQEESTDDITVVVVKVDSR